MEPSLWNKGQLKNNNNKPPGFVAYAPPSFVGTL